MSHSVSGQFASRFGRPPELVVRSPGRINLIGGHTDYNDGFVLPMAIEQATYLAIAARSDRIVSVESTGFGRAEFDLDRLGPGGPAWAEHLKGVAWALGGKLQGWDGWITSDIPVGAGLSSSASIELGAARAFAAISGVPWDPARAARLAQRAENEWVGLNSGIMDQLTVATSRAGHAQLVDCRTLERTYVPLPAGVTVVILDTGTRRRLISSAYNERRAECDRAAKALGVDALRDASLDAVALLDDTLLQARARHIVTENERTLEAAQALIDGDVATAGALIDASHESLATDFDVSSPMLDAIVDAARQAPGCLGARMTGAGFAGCAIALVDDLTVDRFVAETADRFLAATGQEPRLYPTKPTDGVSILDS